MSEARPKQSGNGWRFMGEPECVRPCVSSADGTKAPALPPPPAEMLLRCFKHQHVFHRPCFLVPLQSFSFHLFSYPDTELMSTDHDLILLSVNPTFASYKQEKNSTSPGI